MSQSWSLLIVVLSLGLEATATAAPAPHALASELLRQRALQFEGYRTILSRQPLLATPEGKVVFTYRLTRIDPGRGRGQLLRNAIIVDAESESGSKFAAIRDLRDLRRLQGQVVLTTPMDAMVLKLPPGIRLRALTDGLQLAGRGSTNKSVLLIIEPADRRRTDASFGGTVWLDLPRTGADRPPAVQIHIEFVATRPTRGNAAKRPKR